MSQVLLELLLLASTLPSTTYGHGELMCGDVGKARKCELGAITASGVMFDPSVPSIAIAAPFGLPIEPTKVTLRLPGGKCHEVWLLDKMNPRWIGVRGFDLTPAAVELLTGKAATPYWSGVVEVCTNKKGKRNDKDSIFNSRVNDHWHSKGPTAKLSH